MGLFVLKRLNLAAPKKDKVLRKFPYQMTNKEFKASDKKVIRTNPIEFFFFFLLLFVQKQSMLVLYINSAPREDSVHLKLENFNFKSLYRDELANLDSYG